MRVERTIELKPHERLSFGPGQPVLDEAGKQRLLEHARAWSLAQKKARQHRGPLSRMCESVLKALLWDFDSRQWFPTEAAIAAKAECAGASVSIALKIIHEAGVFARHPSEMREPKSDIYYRTFGPNGLRREHRA
jgi:hypothetical protein